MFKGKVWKEGHFWLIEVPALDVITQGTTKEEAFEMIADAIESLVNMKGFSVHVKRTGQHEFIVSAEPAAPLIALMFKRQRAKKGLTVEDMRRRLAARSRNEYYQYEQGKSTPGIDKILQILKALEIEDALIFNIERTAETAEKKVA